MGIGHLLAVVLEKGAQDLTIGIVVPCLAVVLDGDVLTLAVPYGLGSVMDVHGTCGQLVGAAEGFRKIHGGLAALQTTVVETHHLLEVELPHKQTGRVLPLAQQLFELLFLTDKSDGIDAFVHAKGVLPVVRGLGILGVVLDADGLGGIHVALHDLLLDATHLRTDSVLSVALLDAVATEVARGGARIAHGHGEGTIVVTLIGDTCPVLGVIGHIVLGVVGGAVGLRVGIDTEDGEVARLARPHPVIGLTTELTHGLGNGEDQAQVVEVAVGGDEVAVALVERHELNTQRGVLLAHLFGHDVLDGIEETGALRACHLIQSLGHEFLGDILLLDHEGDKHFLVWQLLVECLGIEAVEHIVVLDCGVAADGLEAAVVIGKDEPVGRNDNARAVAGEVDDGLHNGIVGLIELVVRQLVTLHLHTLIDHVGQVVECPHALIGRRCTKRREERGERREDCNQ